MALTEYNHILYIAKHYLTTVHFPTPIPQSRGRFYIRKVPWCLYRNPHCPDTDVENRDWRRLHAVADSTASPTYCNQVASFPRATLKNREKNGKVFTFVSVSVRRACIGLFSGIDQIRWEFLDLWFIREKYMAGIQLYITWKIYLLSTISIRLISRNIIIGT